MGKTSYTEPNTGAVADAATVNTMFTSLAAAAVGAPNIREEGLDGSVFAADIYCTKVDHQTDASRTQVTSSTFATIVSTASVTLAANEYLRIEAFFELSTMVDNVATDRFGLSGDGAHYRYALFVDSAQIIHSRRNVGPWFLSTTNHGTHAMCHTFAEVDISTDPADPLGSSAIGAGTYTFSLQSRLIAGDAANYENVVWLIRRFARSSKTYS